MYIIAGPCSVESEEQMATTAKKLKQLGVNTIRGGVWKPRTRAHQFEGLGEEGLRILQQIQQYIGVQVTTEVATPSHVELALKYGIDMLWIGARSTVSPLQMQEITSALRGVDIPVLVKNPVCPDLQLWIGAVERLQEVGCREISLIHRGFFTLDTAPYRNAPLWQIAREMQREFPQLPMYCDPSHISGKASLVAEVWEEAKLQGIEHLFIESHCAPQEALTDAAQQLTPEELGRMIAHG